MPRLKNSFDIFPQLSQIMVPLTFLNDFKDHSEVIDIGQFLEEDGRIHFFQFANQMVYFDNILEFLGAAQFEAFSLRFNLCFGTSTRDLASLFKLSGTRVGDGSSEDCKSSILIQSSKNPFKQLDLGDELPFIELAMGYNHVLQVRMAYIVDQNGGRSHMNCL